MTTSCLLSRAAIGAALATLVNAAMPTGLFGQGTPAVRPESAATASAAPKVVKHTVKRGDTLWDIAKFYLKDPFRWPSVFHANTDIIKNPHWIYPGQLLTIDGAAVRDEVAAQVNEEGYVVSHIETESSDSTAFATHRSPPPPKQAVLTKPPVFTVREGEFTAAPFLVDHTRPLGNGVIAAPVDRMARNLKSDAGFQLNDRLFVTAPAGVKVRKGDFLLLARTTEVIPDIGRVVEPAGVLRVDSLAENSVALGEIVRQFGTISRESSVLPLDRSFQATTTRPVQGDYALAAQVLWIRNEPLLSSLQTYVMVNAARAQGIKPGDVFTLYDDREIENDAGVKTPPVATARVQIVRVTPYAATGLIIDHEQPVVRTGMPAHLTAKMP